MASFVEQTMSRLATRFSAALKAALSGISLSWIRCEAYVNATDYRSCASSPHRPASGMTMFATKQCARRSRRARRSSRRKAQNSPTRRPGSRGRRKQASRQPGNGRRGLAVVPQKWSRQRSDGKSLELFLQPAFGEPCLIFRPGVLVQRVIAPERFTGEKLLAREFLPAMILVGLRDHRFGQGDRNAHRSVVVGDNDVARELR